MVNRISGIWLKIQQEICGVVARRGQRLFLLVLVMMWSSAGFAQLTVFPRDASAKKTSGTRPVPSGRAKAHAALTLPFWDDFSQPVGNYPDTAKWVNSDNVWVNDGMAVNQPTVNVATLDGLDFQGLAYSPAEVLVTGYTDTLTSAVIDLGEAALPVAERPTVFMSFFYQWQGNGEPPDSDDFLELEFRDTADQWIVVMTIFPEPDFDRTIFYDTTFQISGVRFFHENFQFRFKSFGRQSGPYDTWNLDYIYINKNRFSGDVSFPDRAAASQPGSLFGSYTAIPYRHFTTSAFVDTLEFDVQNLKGAAITSVLYNVEGTFTNYRPADTTSYTTTLLSDRGVKGSSGAMTAYERVHVTYDQGLPDPADPLQFDPTSEAVDVDLKIIVVSGDEQDADKTTFAPYDLRVNDTLYSSFKLRNYYAYDDGIAEFSAGLIQPGNLIAYRFDMLTYPDTLIGFQIYFPPYAVTNNQTVTFYIYHDDNGKPGEIWETIPSQRIEAKGLNEFHSIAWLPAILIDEPVFYIGWKQPVEGKALVGLDIDNNTGDRMFVNTTSSWYQNKVVQGSLMVRPYFGDGVVDIVDGIEEELRFSVFPNPNKGTFYIEGQFDAMKIYNTAGTEVPFDTEVLSYGKRRIETRTPPGLYLLRIRDKEVVTTYKVLITR